MKGLARRALPAPLYARLGRARKGTARGATDAVAAVLAFLLRLAPTRARLALRQRLAATRRLDWREGEVRLRLTTPVELDLRARSAQKEPETIRWLETTLGPGSVLYDVGANVGAYSLVAAKVQPDARVVAFEPGADTFASLVRNLSLNGVLDRVVALPFALGDSTGLAAFGYASMDAGEARHPGLVGSGAATQRVTAMRLDDVVALLSLPPPTHLKVDVDGAELLVLGGAKSTLAAATLRHALVEVDPAETDLDAVRERLEAAGLVLREEHVRGDGRTRNWTFRRE